MKSPPLACLTTALVAALGTLVALPSAPVHAHGAIPTSNAIGFGPGTGVFLGTNFGGVLVRDGEQRFVCELAMTGFQQSIGAWLWLSSGEVLGIVPTGGFTRGVFASDPTACRYDVLPGTDTFLLSDLVSSAADPGAYYATGSDDTTAVLLHGTPGTAATVIYSDPTAPLATPIGVRAAGGHVYAVFERPGTATLVHDDGLTVTTRTYALADGESLRPLGVSPSAPRTLWLTRSTAPGDTLVRSDDGGATLTPVLTVDARLGGFAIDGATVWVQSARGGVHRSQDDGRTFLPLAGSPHGTCLAVAPAIAAEGETEASDHRLYACGVPWVDGFALGVSSDGKTFAPVLPYYDGIVGAVECSADVDTTATCNGELEFLRGFYGFSNPALVEPGPESSADAAPEPAAEATDVSEPSDTTTAEVDDKPADNGCGGAPNVLSTALLFVLLALGRARSATTKSV